MFQRDISGNHCLNYNLIKLQMMKGKNLPPRNLYPSRLSFRFEGQIKSFTAKLKLKELQKLKAPQNQFYKKC